MPSSGSYSVGPKSIGESFELVVPETATLESTPHQTSSVPISESMYAVEWTLRKRIHVRSLRSQTG
jgi:hypothetical protein